MVDDAAASKCTGMKGSRSQKPGFPVIIGTFIRSVRLVEFRYEQMKRMIETEA